MEEDIFFNGCRQRFSIEMSLKDKTGNELKQNRYRTIFINDTIELMRRFLPLIFILLFLSGCVKEYDYFIPYTNQSVNYTDRFKTKTMKFSFKNDQGFKYIANSGFQLVIPANSFEDKYESVDVLIDYNNSVKDLISNRIQTISANSRIISFDKIVSLKFQTDKNINIDSNENTEIELNIPYEKIDVPKLFRFIGKKWHKANDETSYIFKSTWYSGDSTLVKGYKLKIKKAARIALTSDIEPVSDVTELNVKLPKEFDVNNSLVQLVIKNTNTNIGLIWDDDNKFFTLPEDIVLPANDIIILVFSEEANNKYYFGMKYAKVNNGDIINLNIEQKTIDEIKHLINSIQM